ncbi:HDOD domain-containing protein [bacterium]|nr:HDOD domain-containing protein [bacterium]
MTADPAKRFEKAWDLCSNLWFPIDHRHLDEVLLTLDQHTTAPVQKEQLLTSIKEDPALFSYCIRHASEDLLRCKKKRLRSTQPMKLLGSLEIPHLERILRNARSENSGHSFEQMTEEQAHQLHELLITTSTVEVLARSEKIEPEVGFTTALLRQLGYTLIAWNYPRIYAQAMKRVQQGEQKSQALFRLMGFSPYLLGITTAAEWQLGLEVKASLGDKSAIQRIRSEKISQLGKNALLLRKFCKVGEQLSQAFNPETYPSAGADWNQARREIAEHLGDDGLVLIQNQVKRACKAFMRNAPPHLKALLQESSELDFTVPSGLEAFAKNRALKSVPAPIRDEIKELYRKTQHQSVEQASIKHLVQKVIPRLGFTKGCIYLLNPESLTLEPMVTIGDASLQDFPNADLSPLAREEDPIREAFEQSQPVVLNTDSWDSSVVASYAAVFGIVHRVGVLWLEAHIDPENPDKDLHYHRFLAVRNCLRDFLKLR